MPLQHPGRDQFQDLSRTELPSISHKGGLMPSLCCSFSGNRIGDCSISYGQIGGHEDGHRSVSQIAWRGRGGWKLVYSCWDHQVGLFCGWGPSEQFLGVPGIRS
eukprot:Pompholyxophrys_punicea_v1_NODE_966_length_1086_cov_152.180407.p2 type:complete len:104 gc:universal NODE_966_length_1086_cov_152.180407:600-911(+)